MRTGKIWRNLICRHRNFGPLHRPRHRYGGRRGFDPEHALSSTEIFSSPLLSSCESEWWWCQAGKGVRIIGGGGGGAIGSLRCGSVTDMPGCIINIGHVFFVVRRIAFIIIITTLLIVPGRAEGAATVAAAAIRFRHP